MQRSCRSNRSWLRKGPPWRIHLGSPPRSALFVCVGMSHSCMHLYKSSHTLVLRTMRSYLFIQISRSETIDVGSLATRRAPTICRSRPVPCPAPRERRTRIPDSKNIKYAWKCVTVKVEQLTTTKMRVQQSKARASVTVASGGEGKGKRREGGVCDNGGTGRMNASERRYERAMATCVGVRVLLDVKTLAASARAFAVGILEREFRSHVGIHVVHRPARPNSRSGGKQHTKTVNRRTILTGIPHRSAAHAHVSTQCACRCVDGRADDEENCLRIDKHLHACTSVSAT